MIDVKFIKGLLGGGIAGVLPLLERIEQQDIERNFMRERNWFAGMALQGLVANPPEDEHGTQLRPHEVCDIAMMFGNLMVARLREEQSHPTNLPADQAGN